MYLNTSSVLQKRLIENLTSEMLTIETRIEKTNELWQGMRSSSGSN